MSRKPLVVCTISFAVVLFALAGVVTAEQGRSIEQTDISKLADQAVKIMDVSEVTMQAIYATIEGMLNMISQEAPAELAEKMEKSLKISTLKKEINFDAIEDKLKRRYNSIFSNTYTEEELQALISFYQSPMGKQIIKKQPNLVKLMFPIQEEMLNEIMPKVDQMIMEEMSNLVPGQSGLTELEVKILSQEKDHSVEISLHPDETFNGVYKVQAELINERPWYKNNSDRYLYFYDQAEGGEKSWSLDHRKPNGNKDWFSGGFTLPTGEDHPEPGIYPWQAVSGSPSDDSVPLAFDLANTTFSSPFGHNYIQVMEGSRLREGDASYHFISEENVFINWKHAEENGWRFDNGNFFPEKKTFINTSFDPKTKTFIGELDFSFASVGGATLWKYRMVFSSGYQQIIDGEFVAYNENGDKIETAYFDNNSWFYIAKD